MPVNTGNPANALTVAGNGGLPKIILEHDSGSRAEIYLNGAHVTSWIPANGHEMLFLSDKAVFAPGKAIRGGIPVVFPQFADTGPLPKHGWVRTSEWKLKQSTAADSVTLSLNDDESSMALWHHPYTLDLTVTLGEKFLDLKLDIHNPGAEAFEFTAALHTYLSVGDVRDAEVVGLEGQKYIDKVKGFVTVTDSDDAIRVRAETDRVYPGAPSILTLRDVDRDTDVEIRSSGFPDAVVWNPWIDVARGVADMADDEYLKMICVEAAAAADPVLIEATGIWTGSQRLTVL